MIIFTTKCKKFSSFYPKNFDTEKIQQIHNKILYYMGDEYMTQYIMQIEIEHYQRKKKDILLYGLTFILFIVIFVCFILILKNK